MELEQRIESLNNELDALWEASKPDERLAVLVALIARVVDEDEDELRGMMRN